MTDAIADAVIIGADSEPDIARCHPVMLELRPELQDRAAFIAQVRRQQAEGYRLIFVEQGGRAVACAGYRYQEMLWSGRCLYVDDLVTASAVRSQGYGKLLLDWLKQEARRTGCVKLRLDSGVQRKSAHRFYHREGLTISSFHFGIDL